MCWSPVFEVMIRATLPSLSPRTLGLPTVRTRTLNSSSFVNASSSPRSKLSQCRILRGHVPSEDTFNSCVLTDRLTLLSVSARMLPPIICSCVSTVATPFIAYAACCSLPSNFLLVLCAGDAPRWTRLRCTSTEDRVLVFDWDLRKLLARPLRVPRHLIMATGLSTALRCHVWWHGNCADGCTLLFSDESGAKATVSYSECGISEALRMNDACSGAADDQQGTKTGRWNTHSLYVFVCVCVCLFVCLFVCPDIYHQLKSRPKVIFHWGLGPTTTISILTSGLEHKYRPEFKPNKVKSTHKCAQAKQQTSKLNRVKPAQESDSAVQAHAHPRT